MKKYEKTIEGQKNERANYGAEPGNGKRKENIII